MLWVHFDRRFPARARVGQLYRLEDSPKLARSVGMAEDEIAVLPERIDVVVERVARREDGGVSLKLLKMVQKSLLDDKTYDLAADEDEGGPQDDVMDEKAINCLILGGAELDSESLVHIGPGDGSGEAVVVSTSQELSPSEADLVYLVRPTFLTVVPDSRRAEALKSTATAFATTLCATSSLQQDGLSRVLHTDL